MSTWQAVSVCVGSFVCGIVFTVGCAAVLASRENDPRPGRLND